MKSVIAANFLLILYLIHKKNTIVSFNKLLKKLHINMCIYIYTYYICIFIYAIVCVTDFEN